MVGLHAQQHVLEEARADRRQRAGEQLGRVGSGQVEPAQAAGGGCEVVGGGRRGGDDGGRVPAGDGLGQRGRAVAQSDEAVDGGVELGVRTADADAERLEHTRAAVGVEAAGDVGEPVEHRGHRAGDRVSAHWCTMVPRGRPLEADTMVHP